MSKGFLPAAVAALVMGTSLAPYLATAADAPPAAIAIDEMANRLDLTSEQRARIEPALQERNQRLRALLEERDPSASRRQRFALAREAKGIQQAFIEKVTPELTKEQQAEWKALREEMRGKMRERRRQ